MTPSEDAIDIDEAHRALRDALGTDSEAFARLRLEAVVARVKRKARRQQRGL